MLSYRFLVIKKPNIVIGVYPSAFEQPCPQGGKFGNWSLMVGSMSTYGIAFPCNWMVLLSNILRGLQTGPPLVNLPVGSSQLCGSPPLVWVKIHGKQGVYGLSLAAVTWTPLVPPVLSLGKGRTLLTAWDVIW